MEVDIRLKGIVSAVCCAPLDKAKKKLEKECFKIISVEQNAQLRAKKGKRSYVSQNGNWTREAFIYIPNEGRFLVRESPVLENVEKAIASYEKGTEFYLDEKYLERILADSIEIKDASIRTINFGSNRLTAYLFGKQAQEYGEFLHDSGITWMPLWLKTEDYVNKLGKAFARQLWFGSLNGRSGLIGHIGNFNSNSRLRGIKYR